MLYLPCFTSIYSSIISESNDSEKNRQLEELINITGIIMCRDKRILQSIEEYYGARISDLVVTCYKCVLRVEMNHQRPSNLQW